MYDSQQTWEEAVLWLREQPEQADLVRACFFDDPLRDAADRYHMSTEWAEVRSLVGCGGGTVLDVGAGRGISSYAFAQDGWRVTALEPDPSPVVGAGAISALAAESGLPISVVQAWGESLPFADRSFDLVYGRQVLHHAADLGGLCSEMARVLKPGGAFLASREHVVAKRENLHDFLARHPLHQLYGGEHAYLLQEYKGAIRNAGIRIDKVINPWASPINYYPKTIEQISSLIRQRVPVVPARLLTPRILGLLGWMHRTPGASYSFFGVREE
jgi:SAM-dependent methyltransferase